jgi:hypothetical protein
MITFCAIFCMIAKANEERMNQRKIFRVLHTAYGGFINHISNICLTFFINFIAFALAISTRDSSNS